MNNTKKILADAMVNILQTKSLDKITVKDIVENCGFTRQTFYNHFSDIYELVEWTAQQEIDKTLENFSDYNNWQKGLYRIMVMIKNNGTMLKNIYQSCNRSIVENYLYKVINSYVSSVVEKQSQGMKVDQKDKDFISHFYSLAFLAMIFEWVGNGMKESPRTMTNQTGTLLQGEFKRALQKYAKQ